MSQGQEDKKHSTFSSSTKKGVLQVLGALGMTFLILSFVAYGESVIRKNDIPQLKQGEKNHNNNNKKNQILLNNKDNEDNKCEYSISVASLFCIIAESKLLQQVQNIGVIAAALLYAFEIFDRKKQMQRQAWQLIDGARGSETSGARYQAIEDLYKEDKHKLLERIDLDGADLRYIQLPNSNLKYSNFNNADLEGANFMNADLTGASFKGANLRCVNFSGAILWGAKLEKADFNSLLADYTYSNNDYKQPNQTDLSNANLGGAILNGADLSNTKFGGEKTNLSGAEIRGVNLKNVDLTGVDISNAKFRGTNLTLEQVQGTKNNWEDAAYDKQFIIEYRNRYPDLDLKEDLAKDDNLAQDKAAEILEIIQRVKNGNSNNILEDFIILIKNLEFLVKEDKDICQSESETSNLRDALANLHFSMNRLNEDMKEGVELLITTETDQKNRKKESEQLEKEARKLDEELKKINQDLL